MSDRSNGRALSAAAVSAFAATAVALAPQQFVAGWPIEPPSEAKVFDVPLTAEVYAAATGIEQLAVLDAEGEPQPFFRRSSPPRAPTEQRVVLEASPLYAGGAGAAPSVGVTTSGRGTSVTVTQGAPESTATTGFVLDARAVQAVPVAVELDWRALPEPFLLDINIEQSTDLTNWRGVGRGSVAALAIGDTEARHARVPVRADPGGYLRVTPSRAVAGWHLLRAALVSSAVEPMAPLSVRVLPLAASAGPEDPVPDAFYFDAGGILPVSSVSLRFAASDGWARATIAASHTIDGPWTPVAYRQLFYSLTFEGSELASTPVEVGRQEARYWRVVADASVRAQRLELELAFPQEYLRVAANGRAPFLLAAGTLAEEAGPDATLSAVWRELPPPADVVAVAALGARRELGGPAALVPARAFPWRAAALWIVLMAGVLVVGTMAVRLAREMRNQPS